jgi:AcrR family transcriptional regulator
MPKATQRKRMARTRKERALQTRRRMIGAAYRLFCDSGYAATTMQAIAREASVAVQTLYFTFGTKAAILDEALGSAIVGFDTWTGPIQRFDATESFKTAFDWFPRFDAQPDAAKALEVMVQESAKILRRAAPLASAMSAAAGDPEAAGVQRLAEKRRYESYREIVRLLSAKKPLRRGLSGAKATDILYTLVSASTYQSFTAERGWSDREVVRWLSSTLVEQLFA